MKLVPVLDLKGSQVVAAHLGNRESYKPLSSPLCRSSYPLDVVAALLSLYPFDTLYVADLDAITGSGNNLQSIRRIHTAYPQLALWVDNGIVELEQIAEFSRPIIGSESLSGLAEFIDIKARHPAALLSLDFRKRGFLGPPALLEQHRLWPHEVIVVSLSHVGSSRGPDLALLSRLQSKCPATRFYAGGGVGDGDDLKRLHQIGVSGCLLATALHNGTINGSDISEFIDPRRIQ